MKKNIKIDIKEVTQADGTEIFVFETGEKTRICIHRAILVENENQGKVIEGMIADLLITTAIYNNDVFLVDDKQIDTEVENGSEAA